MKRYLIKLYSLFIAMSFMLYSCSSDDLQILNDVNTHQDDKTNYQRSKEEAISLLMKEIKQFDNFQTTRSYKRQIDKQSIKGIPASQGTRSEDKCIDTLMYIVNFTEDNGYAVVPGDKRCHHLLAITDYGHYEFDDSTNPGLQLFMKKAEKYVVEYGRKFPELDTLQDWVNFTTDTIINSVAPKLSISWGQEYPEGIYCSNGCSGCVNTALAMAMAYYQHPVSIALTFMDAPSNGILFNWDSIYNHKGYLLDGYDLTCSDLTHSKIGLLCRQLGELSNTVYNTNGTGSSSNIYNARNAISFLGYTTSSVIDYDEALLMNFLDNDRLVFMSGSLSQEVGHSWIVDGYNSTTYNINEYHSYDGISWRLTSSSTVVNTYNHINWGANGYDNGYFHSGVFNLNNAYLYDWPYLRLYNDALNYNINNQMFSIYYE